MVGIYLASESCPACQIVAAAVLEWPQSQYGPPGYPGTPELGSWKEYRDRKDCECCQSIVEALKERNDGEDFQYSALLTFEMFRGYFWIACVRVLKLIKFTLNLANRSTKEESFVELVASRESGIPDKDQIVAVDDTLVNMAKLRLWPDYCDNNHLGSCHGLQSWQAVDIASPDILIDVQECCLVRGHQEAKYAALSYVWGNVHAVLETTKSNVSQLSISGSLYLQRNISRIPQTIIDAMTLTKAMDLRYLWVDRLCIVQDDPENITNQLRHMASIFANSYFTIIAAEGHDSSYGLPGLGHRSSSRYYGQSFFHFSSNIIMAMRPGTESHYRPRSTWHTRGWTFQERSVSARTLVFTEGRVYWQCRAATWFENMLAEPDGFYSVTPPEGARSGWPAYSLIRKPWPDLRHYFLYVSGYSSRDLSFESDALKAFTAITTIMSASFPGGLFFGIPEYLFDISLLWSGYGHRPLKRRPYFPSWSWLGWSGRTELLSAYFFWSPLYNPNEYEVHVSPVTVFRKSLKSGQDQYQIDNSYHRNASYSADDQLPPGWAREGEEHSSTDIFTHNSIPHEKFRFPVPILPNPIEFIADMWSPYLYFFTKTCTLQIGDFNCFRCFTDSARVLVSVRDLNQGWAGVIDTTITTESDFTAGSTCQLIAVSKGYAKRSTSLLGYQPLREMEYVEEIRHLDPYEFYNVLWVEWEDGISYRKAIGRVWKEAWDGQDLTEVDVVLG